MALAVCGVLELARHIRRRREKKYTALPLTQLSLAAFNWLVSMSPATKHVPLHLNR
jgi:hypothetical protein